MIQLKDVSKHYPAGFGKIHILRHINLFIKEGEFVSIMGPSGSGKSTLLHILGMLEEPSGGEYVFLEEAVGKLSLERRRDAGTLAEEILDFGLRGVARPELLAAAGLLDEAAGEQMALVGPKLD